MQVQTQQTPVTQKYDGVKIFSATMAKERGALGDLVTEWIANNKKVEITSTVVAQSSDSEFHCTTIVVFYKRLG